MKQGLCQNPLPTAQGVGAFFYRAQNEWSAYCVVGFFRCLRVVIMINSSQSEKAKKNHSTRRRSWGPKLFLATLFAILVFFYWLLIYSGGVTVQHG